VLSDDIHLYANDMQLNYTEYGAKARIEHTEAVGIYSFVFIFICIEYEFKTFGATRDEIRLMSFYLNPDVIDVSLVK